MSDNGSSTRSVIILRRCWFSFPLEKMADKNIESGAGAQKPNHATSTSLFRALNFELFVKPNKAVMIAGILAFSSCVGYIIYWRATGQHKKDTYMALTEKGELEKMERTSRWD